MRRKYTEYMMNEQDVIISKSNVDFEGLIKKIDVILNLEEDMLAAYNAIANVEGRGLMNITQMSIAIIYKNLDYIYATTKLTKSGQYAVARVIFRNIYESLVILKYVSLSNDKQLLEQWIAGEEINVGKKIFKKINSPKSEALETYWADLCRFCHGTSYSCQEGYDYSVIKGELEANYVIILILLYMNYHVLNRYVFSDRMKAMADRLIVVTGELSLKKRRELLRDELKECKKNVSPEARRILIDFSKVWKFK